MIKVDNLLLTLLVFIMIIVTKDSFFLGIEADIVIGAYVLDSYNTEEYS